MVYLLIRRKKNCTTRARCSTTGTKAMGLGDSVDIMLTIVIFFKCFSEGWEWEGWVVANFTKKSTPNSISSFDELLQ